MPHYILVRADNLASLSFAQTENYGIQNGQLFTRWREQNLAIDPSVLSSIALF